MQLEIPLPRHDSFSHHDLFRTGHANFTHDCDARGFHHAMHRGAARPEFPARVFRVHGGKTLATIVAAVVVMLSGAWSFLGDTSNTGATALASYAMMQLPP